MRTKVLLGAVALAAAATSTMAQNVYSLNVVGYINLSLTNGYNLIANQLDVDGYRTNNTLTSVFSTNLPNLTKVSAYDPVNGFITATYAASSQKWAGNSAGATAGLAPGAGVFVQIPAAATYPVTVTLVGQVIQGSNNVTMLPGAQVLSLIAPISTGLSTGVAGAIPAARLDKVNQYLPIAQTYLGHTYSGTTWTSGEPTPAVGEALFYQPTANVTTNRTWAQVFSVQ
jgi:hypothetical protein